MNLNVKSIEQYASIREEQLAEYRKEQQRAEDLMRVPTAPLTVVPVNTQLKIIKKLLNEATALNISSLNLGGGNAQTSIDNNLDYKLNELYQAIKDLREAKKYSGRLIS